MHEAEACLIVPVEYFSMKLLLVCYKGRRRHTFLSHGNVFILPESGLLNIFGLGSKLFSTKLLLACYKGRRRHTFLSHESVFILPESSLLKIFGLGSKHLSILSSICIPTFSPIRHTNWSCDIIGALKHPFQAATKHQSLAISCSHIEWFYHICSWAQCEHQLNCCMYIHHDMHIHICIIISMFNHIYYSHTSNQYTISIIRSRHMQHMQKPPIWDETSIFGTENSNV